jgi:replication factor C subunit 1
MDEYFISREDLDTLIELGVDELQDEIVNKKIASATKAALTRKCVQWKCNASTRH